MRRCARHRRHLVGSARAGGVGSGGARRGRQLDCACGCRGGPRGVVVAPPHTHHASRMPSIHHTHHDTTPPPHAAAASAVEPHGASHVASPWRHHGVPVDRRVVVAPVMVHANEWEWNGIERSAMVCNGMQRNGMEWNGMERSAMVQWYAMVCNRMEWNGMQWYGTEWNGMERNAIECSVASWSRSESLAQSCDVM